MAPLESSRFDEMLGPMTSLAWLLDFATRVDREGGVALVSERVVSIAHVLALHTAIFRAAEDPADIV